MAKTQARALPRPQTVNVGGSQPVKRTGPKAPIDIQEEFNKIRAIYPDRGRGKANFLIIGPHGEGKTYNIVNAPGPILIHSFDQGGSECIPEEHIKSGRVIIDSRFEDDSPHTPVAYRAWEAEFLRLKRSGFFEHIGTYVIDSWTRFSQALMNEILKSRGRKPPSARADLGRDPDIVPEMGDYNVHQKTLAMNLADITSLPCNTAVLAHLNTDKDENTGRLFSSVMMDGKKFAQMVPTLFDEVYFASSKPKGPNERIYTYQLVPRGHFPARSRLRGDGSRLGAEEEQNLAEILKKAGRPYEDKPLFNE